MMDFYKSVILVLIICCCLLLQENRKLKRLSTSDCLTGLLNLRGLQYEMTKVIESAKRKPEPVSVILLDINKFKNINDTYGHHAGDICLKDVADALKRCTRLYEVVARVGGDEFVVLLREDSEKAQIVVERIREEIQKIRVHKICVSASIGVTTVTDSSCHSVETLLEKLKESDKKMYAEKNAIK